MLWAASAGGASPMTRMVRQSMSIFAAISFVAITNNQAMFTP